MRAGGGRPSNRVGNEERQRRRRQQRRHPLYSQHCHVRTYDAYIHVCRCTIPLSFLPPLSRSLSSPLSLSLSLGPDHPPRAVSLTIFLCTLFSSPAPSLLFSHSSPLLSSVDLSVSLSLAYSSLGYNVAASGAHGIIAGCVRSLRLCTAGAGTYYADVCNPLCASRIRVHRRFSFSLFLPIRGASARLIQFAQSGG